MQIETAANVDGSAVFPAHTKDRALKLLIDYKLATGRKWQRICSEILKTTDAPATSHAPILTRQDLEAWERRNTILGDAKFKWVLAFLTHPATLERPEFARARDLLGGGQIERIGGAFADFFSDHENSAYIHRPIADAAASPNTGEERLEGFEGCFIGQHDASDWCLSLQRYKREDFFVAHFFSWPQTKRGEPSDWEVDRWSGFCTIGNFMRIHTKGLTVPIFRDFFAHPHLAESAPRTDHISLIMGTLIYKAIEFAMFDNFNAAHKRMQYIAPDQHTVPLNREQDGELNAFIDHFRWNIAI